MGGNGILDGVRSQHKSKLSSGLLVFKSLRGEQVMELPTRVQEIIDEMYKKNKQLAFKEDDQRTLSRLIAEQIVFETKDDRWGVKSAALNRPQSPSNIAFNGGELIAFRWLDGDGSISGIPFGVAHPPVVQSIPGQIFIPVNPYNHLGLLTSSPSPSTPPIPNTAEGQNEVKITLSQILTEVKQSQIQFASLVGEILDLHGRLTSIELKQDRRLTAKIFGVTVVISPEK